MDVDRRKIVVVLGYVLAVCLSTATATGNVVFSVRHKFAGRDTSLNAYRSHDSHRHGRMLSSTSAADIPLGGNSRPTDAALYYTKIALGTPQRDYHVQVDTGSDLLWVNCADCENCPKKSKLGIDLQFYNPKESGSASAITCQAEFCTTAFNTKPSSDCKAGMICQYSVTYGDGSTTSGYFIEDQIHLDRVSGNSQTSKMAGSVAFGCGAKQSGELGSSTEALDGIIGFGQANSSVISQLSTKGKVKKVFSHCLEGAGNGGGGIFAIGELVEPKIKSTPLVKDEPHYNVNLEDVKVGDDVIDLPKGFLGIGGADRGTIIDSGTTLAYLTDELYGPVMNKIMKKHSDLKVHIVEKEFKCFEYSDNVDEGFPVVTFNFEKKLSLSVHPHDYLFQIEDDRWCIGWQNSGMTSKDGKEINILGDLALANKIVLYDLEEQTVGWTDYNCSSGVKVRDDASGNAYVVAAHDISPSSAGGISLNVGLLVLALILLFTIHHSPLPIHHTGS